jgi:hypothetical protein
MYKEVVLTKDNLARRNWNRGKQCCFCHKNETIKRLFYECFMQNLYGAYHKLLLILHHRTVFVTCLVHGYISMGESWKDKY